MKASLPGGRGCSGPGLAVFGDDIFMFGGGDPPGSGHYPYVHNYDLLNDLWIQDVAIVPYPIGGVSSSSLATFGDKIYLFGGVGNTPGVNYYHDETFEFDPVSFTLTPKSPMPTVHRSMHTGNGGAYVVGEEIWLAAGADDTPDILPIYVYDPVNDTWGTSRSAPPEWGRTARVDGWIFLVRHDLSAAWAYDADADVWIPVPSSFEDSVGLRGFGCLADADGKLYAMGGSSDFRDREGWVIEGVIDWR